MYIKKETKKVLLERKIVQELIAGKSNRAISQLFKICHKKVARIKKYADKAGYLDKTNELPPYPEHPFPDVFNKKEVGFSENDELLISHLEWIKERLNSGWHKVTVYEELPIKVARASFYRFLKRQKLEGTLRIKGKVIPEIFHNPGESLILDWGLLRTVLDPDTGKKKKLWAFVGVLGYSRLMIVKLVWHFDTKTTIQAIEEMFRELGGVTLRITTDNPKCFSIEASDYEPLLNPIFERFADHFGFITECLPPADPQKKGKVERLMPFVRRMCEAYTDFKSIEDMQCYLNKKIGIANERKHGTILRKPLEVFIEEEASCLKGLPPLSYEIEEFSEGKSRQDGFVRFSGKYYSIGTEYSGKNIIIIANQSIVSFYYKGKLLETHSRINGNMKYKSTKKHHLKNWEQVSEDHACYLDRAKKVGENCLALVSVLLSLGNGFVDTRIIWVY